MTRWYRSTGDLLVIALWTALASAGVLVLGIEQQLLRILLVIPLVLFIPGYAALAALYPERRSPPNERQRGTDTSTASIDGLERLVLSVVVSISLVPLTAFVVNYTPYGVRLRPIMVAVASLTGFLIFVGLVQRLRTPVDRRYGVSPLRKTATLWSDHVVGDDGRARYRGPLVPTSNPQRYLNLLLVVSLLALVASVGFAAVTPAGDDDPFTEVYLLTQNDDGEFTTEGIPTNFSAGESQTLFVALGNHEHERTSYTVVVTLDEQEQSRFQTTVNAGETKRVERQITLDKTGNSLPLRFLVYQGEAPENPSPQTAYRTAKLWVNVR